VEIEKKKFVEGWVEFADKEIAESVAATLNNTNVGGNRRSLHYYDLWNIKYLPDFKWYHLTEKQQYERKVRNQRLQLEIAQAKKENNEYLLRVEKAHVIREIEKRKKKERNEEYE